MSHQFSAAIGKYPISFETGKLAGQAGGAVTVSCGDTLLLATATMSRTAREGIDFFPLRVDYEERLYAAGRIPGSFFRREGRPHEGAILTCRLVDRPIRPLFPKGLRNEVQIIITALSHDQEHQIDILAILGASAALTISDIPFSEPIGAVRVGYVDGEFIFNPTFSEMEHSALDLRLAGTADAVLMVEAGANEVSEDIIVEAIKAGHEAMQPIIALQEEMRRAVGKPKRTYTSVVVSEDVKAAVAAQLDGRLRQLLIENPIKSERNEALDALQDEVIAALSEQYAAGDVKAMFHEILRDEIRRRIIEEGVRPDGRDFTTVRPVSCETGLLPRAHGSGLFNR